MNYLISRCQALLKGIIMTSSSATDRMIISMMAGLARIIVLLQCARRCIRQEKIAMIRKALRDHDRSRSEAAKSVNEFWKQGLFEILK